MKSSEFSISNVHIMGHRNYSFNGEKSPENFSKHLQIQTKTTLLKSLVGLESLEQIAEKLREEFVIEVLRVTMVQCGTEWHLTPTKSQICILTLVRGVPLQNASTTVSI